MIYVLHSQSKVNIVSGSGMSPYNMPTTIYAIDINNDGT